MKLWAVIPSRNRREQLNNLYRKLIKDNVHVVIVDNGYTDSPIDVPPEFTDRVWFDAPTVIKCHDDPPNLSQLWNFGLKYVHRMEAELHYGQTSPSEYCVAVLNDDIIIPDRFVSRLAEALETTGGAAAYPDQHGYGQTFKHEYAGPISLYRRMTGYAFALRGSAGIYADETLQWWYGDDDIDWRARQNGGSVLVGGLKVEHLTPNQTTVGVLAEQAGRDRETFIKKWGRAPW